MSPIDHFSNGAFTPVLSYVMSVVGSLLGLVLASRARGAQGAARIRWLAVAAISIGGTGIWVMHFIAMMGFSVRGVGIRYDVPLTIVSAVVAIVMVGVGLLLVSRGGERLVPLALAGLLTGLGVAGMHYMGMAAMHMPVTTGYDPLLVAASVLIAVVASTVALWFTLRVEGALATTGAALIMGLAVCGMHYTGMFSLSVSAMHPADGDALEGVPAISFLLPMLIGISLLTLVLLLTVMLSPSRRELETEAMLLAQLRDGGTGHAPSTPAPPATPSMFDSRRPGGS
ncbi:MHYT domain-containing protein [Sphaerisporangium flaviroseum]|uniref:MHYT domain-containing protein n=1 Tax=Sphaerisporangium flaviroseum TaxID=509199 RepID=A0ABP7HV23_9ACTN